MAGEAVDSEATGEGCESQLVISRPPVGSSRQQSAAPLASGHQILSSSHRSSIINHQASVIGHQSAASSQQPRTLSFASICCANAARSASRCTARSSRKVASICARSCVIFTDEPTSRSTSAACRS